MKRQFAEQYAGFEEWHWWFRGRQKILEAVLRKHLDPSQNVKLASLGCGPVAGLSWLLPFAGGQGLLLGCDVDWHHGKSPTNGFLFVAGNMEALPLAPASFDLVLALDVVEHLDEDVKALAEAKRILKPGGLLIATVPAMPSFWGSQDIVSHHRRRYTKRMLSQALAEAGFCEPKLTYFNTLLFPVIASIRWTRAILGTVRSDRSDFEDNSAGLVNEVLAQIFAAEKHIVARMGFAFGVSLLAVCRS